ncbi:Leucine-rich repeat and guanylate kinase domain-containing protein [Myotis brandtii]|uniref:Leucine-rich repeat and guanylate kinase domain-containing protein n=1 Tax=Myotis brandtii TaxID=109478 RepID=S7MQ92_MYOBR|nr:Leucine-rich repeat and guanylate kinase domain-containing protein [Myotis brandtii]
MSLCSKGPNTPPAPVSSLEAGCHGANASDFPPSHFYSFMKGTPDFFRQLLFLDVARRLSTNYESNIKVLYLLFSQGSDLIDISILCGYVHLQKLDLSVNKIGDLSCVSCMPYLLELNASQNKLTSFFNFKPPKNLKSHNLLEKIMGLDRLRALKIVDLSHNQIKSLQGLENHDFLEVINLEDNKIAELGEIEYIENLPLLRVLNLLKNPIQEHCEYWLFVIFMLLQLTELDQKKITVEEKVFAVNKYNPPPEVVAAQDHLTHVVHSVMQPQRIFDSTLPSLDAPYPMLVLAGPEDCGKRELAHRLCRQFSTYFRYGACHTTRPPYFGEGDRVDYQFISEEAFNKMVHMGVRSLKLSHFEPRYILVLPLNKKKYEGHLRRKGLFSRVEIEFAVSRVDHYIKINQKSPGFFDAVINADDLDAAYQQLSQLVQEYLGLGQDTATGLAPPAGTVLATWCQNLCVRRGKQIFE